MYLSELCTISALWDDNYIFFYSDLLVGLNEQFSIGNDE